ncbi:L,D-transpeptidase [Labrys portucalensis]|uniref:L,D-transpeptidase n=1 Tax=Labrys neptuniae TaxID=376174 RepID=A0ABV6ZFK5_9HYPH|nr:L,D-transpeptidase [Labrys sp. ZIDIC5]MDZ5452682.1 L,D-transpeptidase [Labrys sp. ZIDIC5]
MPQLSRRLFVLGAPLLLAGCASSKRLSADSIFDGWGGSDYDYGEIYAGFDDNGNPVPAIDLRRIDGAFLRREVSDPTGEAPGTIVVDPPNHYLYHVHEGGNATRYGVGVGREGFAWNGRATIKRKAVWPRWTPPSDMVKRDSEAAKWAGGMPGGPGNPLGARAMYLFQGDRDTLYRLHGTIDPSSIGKSMSSGCIRLLNQDIIHLYNNTPVGTRVVVLGNGGDGGDGSYDDQEAAM